MFAEKDKNCENGSNFGVSREQNIFISGEGFEKCEIFLDISMHLTLLYNSVLHVLTSPMTRAGDNKPFMIKKCVFVFGRVKRGDKDPLFAVCPKNVSRVCSYVPKFVAACKNSESSDGWFSRSIW